MGRVKRRSWEAGLEQLAKSYPGLGWFLGWVVALAWLAWTVWLLMIVVGWVNHSFVPWSDRTAVSFILWATIWHLANRIVFGRWVPYEP